MASIMARIARSAAPDELAVELAATADRHVRFELGCGAEPGIDAQALRRGVGVRLWFISWTIARAGIC